MPFPSFPEMSWPGLSSWEFITKRSNYQSIWYRFPLLFVLWASFIQNTLWQQQPGQLAVCYFTAQQKAEDLIKQQLPSINQKVNCMFNLKKKKNLNKSQSENWSLKINHRLIIFVYTNNPNDSRILLPTTQKWTRLTQPIFETQTLPLHSLVFPLHLASLETPRHFP